MFDVAFSELVVIGIIALIVLGPKRLPEVARTAGRWMGKIRHFVEAAKRDMQAEMRRDELAELRQVKDQLIETKNTFEQATAPLASIPEALASIPEPAATTPPSPTLPVTEPPVASKRTTSKRKAPVVKKKKKSAKAVTRRRTAKHG